MSEKRRKKTAKVGTKEKLVPRKAKKPWWQRILHLFGIAIILNALVDFNNYNGKLPSGEGLFGFKNRSI